MNKFLKITKKIVLGVSVAVAALTMAATSACSLETKHPKAEIKLELRSEDEVVASVTLKYELYRNIHPVTVKHFIELADEKFYDGMIIHDMGSNGTGNDWFTGGYRYDGETYETLSADGGTMAQYLSSNSLERAYYDLASKLTPSVYKSNAYSGDKQIVKKEDALATVLGEFKNNINQEIKNDPLSESFGCLKMFYYEKETTDKVYVTPTKDEIILADYKTNSATSLFTIQVANSSSYKATNYSVFALLKNTDDLDEFVDKVDEYIDNLTTSYVKTTINVDNMETFSKEDADNGIEKEFYLPTVPLVVKSVKITKY